MDELILVAVPGTDPPPSGPGAGPATGPGAAKVSVLVVPKLDAADDISATSLRDWPSRLADGRCLVEFDSGSSVEGAIRHQADPDLWRVFWSGIPVLAATPPTPPPAPTDEVKSSTEAAAIERTYSLAAGAVAPQADGAPVPPEGSPELQQVIETQLHEDWVGEPTLGTRAQSAPDAAGRRVPRAVPELDVHRVVAALREHPTVLRRLGLIFDLVLPADSPGTTPGGSGILRVRLTTAGPELSGVVSSPRSRYVVHPQRGLLPADGSIARGGFADLSDITQWATTTVDLDGAATLLRQTADQAQAGDGRPSLPPLRSGGVSLMQVGQADALRHGRERAAGKEARRNAGAVGSGRTEDVEPLDADALMLGLRVDVRATGRSWMSLMRRVPTYEVGGQPLAGLAADEGHLRPAALHLQEDGAVTVDELAARWQGWSLAVPRQGLAGRAEGRARRNGAAQVPFSWGFEVPPGSLLPLRFGHDYELRARVVDLVGGSPSPDLRDAAVSTSTIPYRRWEPLTPPSLRPTAEDLGPGGGLESLVIRSDATDYPANDQRLLGTPVVSAVLAEQHGALDGVDEDTFTLATSGDDVRDSAAGGTSFQPVATPGAATARRLPVGWVDPWPTLGTQVLRLVPWPGSGPALEQGDDTAVDGAARATVEVRLAPAEELYLDLSTYPAEDTSGDFAVTAWRSDNGVADPSGGALATGLHPMLSPAVRVHFVHAVRRPLATPAGTLTSQRVPDGLDARLDPQPLLLALDVASTVQADLTGSWTEYADDQRTEVTGAPVQTLILDRGITQLPATLVHRVGDTRHRAVRYALTATSRFRHCYSPDDDAELFLTHGELGTVSLRSTAAPPAPVVRAVVPSFGWSRTTTGTTMQHVRSGGLLRVELERPWFVSGEGEQLGVILDGCVLARDPIWQTPGPPTSAGTGLVAHDVAFAGDRWVADVDLSAATAGSYRPFVTLSLVRYQAESLPGLERSAVVTTPLVQVLPARTLVVETGVAGQVDVRLDGLGPEGPILNRVDVVLEAPAGPGAISVASDGGAGPVGWQAVAQAIGGLGSVLSLARPDGPVRVRVREVEQLGPQAPPTPGASAELGDRVVFTDLVDLSSPESPPTRQHPEETP